jgi:raffinose/stachyose/melibiose transport system permease protein
MLKKTYPLYFVFGALLVYLVFVITPGIIGIMFSFTDWSSYSNKINFIGFANFAQIFQSDNNYMQSIFNTLIFTVVTTLIKTALGLLFAILLSSGVRGQNMHRAIIFIPSILSMLITGLTFKSILNPATGLLNGFLGSIGLGALQMQWLTDIHIAFGSVMAVDIWRGIGYIMTIILAGIQSIDRSYYEASSIDGATFGQNLWYVTLPMIIPALTVSTVLNLLYGLKVFDIVYVLTNGGPGYVTEVLQTQVLKIFSLGSYGLATAMNSLLFVFMVIVGYFVIRAMNREEVEA